MQADEIKNFPPNTEKNQTARPSEALTFKILLVFLPITLIPLAVVQVINLVQVGAAFRMHLPEGTAAPVFAELLVVNMAAIVATAVVAALLIWLITRSITRPIIRISQAAEHYLEGNWAPLEESARQDEIGKLASAVESLAQNARSINLAKSVNGVHRTQNIRLAAEMIEELSSAANLSELLQSTVRQIANELKYASVSIYILDESAAYLLFAYSAGSQSKTEPIGRPAPIPVNSRTMIGWTAANNEARVANEVEKDPLFTPDRGNSETRAELVLPVSFRQKVLAVLDIHSLEPGAFNTEDVLLLQAVSNLLGAAINNLQVTERIQVSTEAPGFTGAQESPQKQMAELQVISEIVQAASEQTDLQSLYEVFHRGIERAFGTVNTVIAFYEPETNLIEVPYLYEGNQVIKIDPFPLGEGLTSVVLRTKQPLLLNRIDKETIARLGAKIVGTPSKSWLGVPMLIAGEPIGAIVLQDQEVEDRFKEDDVRLLSTIAGQIAVSVRNARLLEQTRRQAERERILHELTSKIRSTVDIQTILETTATELGKSLGARRAVIEVGVQPEPGTEIRKEVSA